MFTLQVEIDDQASEMLRVLSDGISGEKRREMMQVGARSALNAAKDYHRGFNAGNRWRGSGNSGTGKSKFGAMVTAGWHTGAIDNESATIYNDAPYYRHKVEGGTIKPTRAKFLTIPLIEAARGRTAAEYQATTGSRLFPVKGVLAEKQGDGIRPVFALRKSVTQRPWPGALPDGEEIGMAFVEGAGRYLERLITKGSQ